MNIGSAGIIACLLIASTSLVGCSSGDESPAVAETTVVPPSATVYRIELVDAGAADRHVLVAPVPVGRRAEISVQLASLGERIEVRLDASVIQSGASGGGQLIDLVVVGVDADDPDTVVGLQDIVGASSRLVRDERLAVVEQQLDVPEGLAFRPDAVVRQALRSPFALAGPMVTEAVGDGASWTIDTVEDGVVAETTVVEVISADADGYVLSLEVPGGSVMVTGQAGALLPDEQVITLDDATVTVVAERSS